MTKKYQRFDIHQRLQHALIGLSFILCAITGIAIKYHQSTFAEKAAHIFRGFDGLITWHIVGAIVVLGTAVYHILYLLYNGLVKKKVSWAMVPTLQDGKDIVLGLKWSLGLTKEQPKFDRYSWKEKFDYLAVFWGMMAIGATGIIMWFPEWAAGFMPRWVIDCCRMAHSDEAILAVTFIAFWHFYNVHFSADIFPMSKVWLDGEISHELMEHEHPLELERILEQGKTKLPELDFIPREEGINREL